MTAPTPTHAWLRRLSDYHSGAATEAERIAVEEHLATCAQCQEALAMYRRLYSLLRSPLQLGGPSADFDDSTVLMTETTTATRHRPPRRRPTTRDPRNRRALAGLAAALAAAMIITGFLAVLAPRLHPPTVAGTPSPRPSPTTPPSTFVCANPQRSTMTYAYVRGDLDLYTVTGCNAPRRLTNTHAAPLAWSPSNRYLAAYRGSFGAPQQVEIIDTQTDKIVQTRFAANFGNDTYDLAAANFQVPIFFGWLDDSSFLGGITSTTYGGQASGWGAGPTTLVRVDFRSGRETTLGRIPGWANVGLGFMPNVRVVAGGRYLFYASDDGATATGWLHRFDLTTATDIKLVSLGAYGFGGCDEHIPICGWTAPWDVTSDGTHILYHHPGPPVAYIGYFGAHIPADTLVVYANSDGSGPRLPFGTQVATQIVAPVFSPDGTAAVTTGATLGYPSQVKVVRLGGALAVVAGSFQSWRGDSAAVVIAGDNGDLVLYDLTSGKTTPLEANAMNYLWAN